MGNFNSISFFLYTGRFQNPKYNLFRHNVYFLAEEWNAEMRAGCADGISYDGDDLVISLVFASRTDAFKFQSAVRDLIPNTPVTDVRKSANKQSLENNLKPNIDAVEAIKVPEDAVRTRVFKSMYEHLKIDEL
jgi:hypothetical protein